MRYHVTEKWDGKDLQTAANRYGEVDAIQMYMEKWETDDGAFAADQVSKIYLYDTIEDAQDHQSNYGGEILEIDDSNLEISIDEIEGYPTTQYDISAKYIRRI